MKSKILTKQPSKASEYPRLKIGTNGTVVLFTSKGNGMCVYAGEASTNFLGECDNEWAEDSLFTDFNEDVILSNN